MPFPYNRYTFLLCSDLVFLRSPDIQIFKKIYFNTVANNCDYDINVVGWGGRKEVWWSTVVVRASASRSPIQGSNLGPGGPPHSVV